jgi:hypothetical protein
VLMHLAQLGLRVIQHDNASADQKKIKRWHNAVIDSIARCQTGPPATGMSRKRTPRSCSRRALQALHEYVSKVRRGRAIPGLLRISIEGCRVDDGKKTSG